jgi:branched-chain amino acid transport system substrate-binding protein
MKKLMAGAAISALTATSAFGMGHGAPVTIGVILGFTGPIESLTPDMAAGAELAVAEANASGNFLMGKEILTERADSTCVDASAATAAAERLITASEVVAIMGADCSGVTTAVANNVAIPNGVVMVSPSATSPALSEIDDNGLFFRTAPSDARQGQVIAEILGERGVTDIAVTYTNNDYGKGLADAFEAAFTAAGGSVSITAAHEDGKGDYSAEVGALSAAGSDALAVFGYVDQGGRGIIQSSLDSGAFDTFVLGDGMIGDSLTEALGSDIDGTYGTAPGATGDAFTFFDAMAKANGIEGDGPYRGESYDAAALIVLAMQAGGEATREAVAQNLLSVANAPGVPIGPGQIGVALQLLENGVNINYQGATGVELIGPGEAAGAYIEYEVIEGVLTPIGNR